MKTREDEQQRALVRAVYEVAYSSMMVVGNHDMWEF
jgi:hypothetical protein